MDFLDYLTDSFGLPYLSDLHTCTISSTQAEDFMNLPEHSFTLDDYNCAASYILNEPASFENILEAKLAIVAQLSRSNQ